MLDGDEAGRNVPPRNALHEDWETDVGAIATQVPDARQPDQLSKTMTSVASC